MILGVPILKHFRVYELRSFVLSCCVCFENEDHQNIITDEIDACPRASLLDLISIAPLFLISF